MITTTKKQVLAFSAVAAVIFAVLYTNYLSHTYCLPISSCADFFKMTKIIFLVSVVLLPMSLFVCFLEDQIFLLLKKFTSFYLLGYLVAVLVAPWEGEAFFRAEKGTVAIFLCGAYVIISLILIAYKYFTLRKDGAGK